jgi:hypothetical protein
LSNEPHVASALPFTRSPQRRRDVLSLLGGGAVSWPLAAIAHRASGEAIGFLNSASLEPKPKSLGLEVPVSLQLLAHEVIE